MISANLNGCSFEMIKSDDPLIRWICTFCHSGPHMLIFECQGCNVRACSSCNCKADGYCGRTLDDEGISGRPRQRPRSPDHGLQQAGNEASHEQDQSAARQTNQPRTEPIRTTNDKTDGNSVTPLQDEDETNCGGLVSSVLSETEESMVDRLMEQFHGLLQELANPPPIGCCPGIVMGESVAGRTCAMGFSSSVSSGSSRDSVSSTQASTSHLGVNAKKRRKERSSTNGDEKDDEDDGEGQRMTSSEASEVKDGTRKLACPFAKRYPGQTPRLTICAYPGWTTTHRVKEHLYRRHVRPDVTHCSRCYEEFESDSLLEQHVRKAERCAERERPPPEEGLNYSQEKSLKCRKRIINTSEEEKWKRVYRICFPDVAEADIPSPYVDHVPGTTNSFDLTQYQLFLNEKLPELLRQEVRNMVEGHPMWPQIAEDLSSRRLEILDRCLDRFVENESLAEHSGHVEENEVHAPIPASTGDVQVSSICIDSPDDSHEAPLVLLEAPVSRDLRRFSSDTSNALTLDQICNLNTSLNKKSSQEEKISTVRDPHEGICVSTAGGHVYVPK